MNCKPGDLAVVIAARHTPQLIGALVRVLRLATPGETISRCFFGQSWVQVCTGESSWLVEKDDQQWFHRDCALRPIRDQPGQDETLTWAPVPATPEVRTTEAA
jgi:hypothetical protein